nr:NAD(P)/FAD-dependent oxidoreductase [Winogradskyella wandonensis]
MQKNEQLFWRICPSCKGIGKKNRRPSEKTLRKYRQSLEIYSNKKTQVKPEKPKDNLKKCIACDGSGLISTSTPTEINTNYPNVAIIGGGIGGFALAAAFSHRGIPFTIYEKDRSFNTRSQGYGLTLQQASKALKGFGITTLKEGVVSTKHIVHTTEGEIIGEWGMRKWLDNNTNPKKRKNTNIHIARQSLRLSLHNQVKKHDAIKWGHEFLSYQNDENEKLIINFKVGNDIITSSADLIVGADGIRSGVRQQLFIKDDYPLNYLDCFVMLGICPIKHLNDINSPLLDLKTVFQTANGNERIYVMPYSTSAIMWQLSFTLPEEDAKILSRQQKSVLKQEAYGKTQWHYPIPEIIKATPLQYISGYPVYDRDVLNIEDFKEGGSVTLIGDAAHPMSPFKGQGANQALLDALSLARRITKTCRINTDWKEKGIRTALLESFERDMLHRTRIKVKASADAAKFLHSEVVLKKGNSPRGKAI